MYGLEPAGCLTSFKASNFIKLVTKHRFGVIRTILEA